MNIVQTLRQLDLRTDCHHWDCFSSRFHLDYKYMFTFCKCSYDFKQECIPVGCVLPASVAITGGVCLRGVCLGGVSREQVSAQGVSVCSWECLPVCPGGCT